MPIKRVRGNILKAHADMIYIPVNRVGVMGAGLARQFRCEYPELYEEYVAICRDTDWLEQPSMSMVFVAESPLFVLFPTKNHWRDRSSLSQIESYLSFQFNELHNEHFAFDTDTGFGVKTIAIPPLGAGLGGLDTQKVLETIEELWEESGQNKKRTLLLYAGR